MLPLGLIEGNRGRGAYSRGFRLRWEVNGEGRPRTDDDGTLYYIPELSHVPWPGVLHQGIKSLTRDRLNGLSHGGAKLFHEGPSQERYILPTFPQRRYPDRKDVQT